MRRVIEDYIKKCDKLDCVKYHSLLNLFGRELVHKELDCYLEKQLENDFSFEKQCELWGRFGYYLAILEHSVFEKKALLEFSEQFNGNNRLKESLEEEKMYGYHLLCKDYIMICCDEAKNKVDMKKIFASVRSVSTRDLILSRFDDLYKMISRTSNYDKEMKDFLADYKRLCVDEQVPVISYQGELLDEITLIEQVEMYIRYCVAKEWFISNNYKILYDACNKTYLTIEKEDIFNEGYFGLLGAVENFDIRRGIYFFDYAVCGIKFSIWKYFDKCYRVIRLPSYLETWLRKVTRFNYKFFSLNGRFPTVIEIMMNFNISVEMIQLINRALFYSKVNSLDSMVVTDNYLSEEGSNELLVLNEVINDPYHDYDIEDMIDVEYANYVFEVIISENILSDSEMDILKRKLNGDSYKKIGQLYGGVSKQAIEQRYRKALNKIKSHPKIQVKN